jgi:alpha-tubulin suppressor-like RCC1 family protein
VHTGRTNGTPYYYVVTAQNSGGESADSSEVTATPIAILVTLIIAGENDSLALKSNGQVWAWGVNGSGRLGDNTTTSKSSPVLVVGGHVFSAIGGYSHSLALKSNGQVWAWGVNGGGQLGDNTTNPKSSPVLVVGGHSFTAIEVGKYGNSLALKANGEVWAWGYDDDGELGDNSSGPKSSPVLVVGGHSFIAIGAGLNHSLALKANGEVWAWGASDDGELGNNTNWPRRSSPVLVVGLV